MKNCTALLDEAWGQVGDKWWGPGGAGGEGTRQRGRTRRGEGRWCRKGREEGGGGQAFQHIMESPFGLRAYFGGKK